MKSVYKTRGAVFLHTYFLISFLYLYIYSQKVQMLKIHIFQAIMEAKIRIKYIINLTPHRGFKVIKSTLQKWRVGTTLTYHCYGYM